MLELYNPFFGLFVVINLLALIVLFVSWQSENLGRLIYAAVFLIAGIVNAWLGIAAPKTYLYFGQQTWLRLYEDFIYGFFSEYTTTIILGIAFCQILIAIGLFFRGSLWLPALYGAVFYLWVMLPLGLSAAFPAPFIMAITLIIIARREAGNIEMEGVE